uniref:C3H1-type domain-containing protein n=1 Tax=Syphacia muris TaxID=451379 RepID=A0A0N5B0V7_9BILA
MYGTNQFGSVLHSAISAPFQRYQMPPSPEINLHYPPAPLHGPPPPLPPFFGYNSNIGADLNNAVPSVSTVPTIEANSNFIREVHSEFWPQPPPPPPPLLFNASYNGPVQTTSGCYTAGDVAASTSYNSVTSYPPVMEDYQTIIQPPPPPHFLLASATRKHPIGSTTSDEVSSSAANHSFKTSNVNKDLKTEVNNKRARFTGVICDLPENSRRPQVSEGRTFPLKVHGEYLRYDSTKLSEKDLHHSRHYNGSAYQHSNVDFNDTTEEPVILTATKFVRKFPSSNSSTAITSESNGKDFSRQHSPKSWDSRSGRSSAEVIESVPGTSEERPALNPLAALKRTTSSGTLSRNGMSWRRRTSVGDSSEMLQKTHLVQKKKGSFRLRRIKGEILKWFILVIILLLKEFFYALALDQVFTEDSNECFEFAEYGLCTPGVFCIYDHKGDGSHRTVKLCARLLKGRCRKDTCKYPHLLQPHQMPVCDYYIRRICTKEHCQFLHVKHSDNAKPCEQFNRGICKLGDDCLHPHRYYRAIIIKRGQEDVHGNYNNVD